MATNPEQRAGGISIHAVDIAGGVPAAGLGVRLWLLGDERVQVAAGTCSESGLLRHPVAEGAGVERGMYEVEFDGQPYMSRPQINEGSGSIQNLYPYEARLRGR